MTFCPFLQETLHKETINQPSQYENDLLCHLLKSKLFFLICQKICTIGPSNSGAFKTGTETGFTWSRSPIQIQCGLSWAPHGMQTTRIALLDWISCTVMQHSTQLRSRSRLCEEKVVFRSGSPIHIGSGSKVLCGVFSQRL